MTPQSVPLVGMWNVYILFRHNEKRERIAKFATGSGVAIARRTSKPQTDDEFNKINGLTWTRSQ